MFIIRENRFSRRIIQEGAHLQVLISFAQWQYHNRWGSPEVWLLLVENFNQYPAMVKWNILRRRQFLIAPTGARIITKMSQLYLISYGTNRMLFIGALIATRSNLIMPMINRKLFACFHIQNYRNKYKGLQYEIRGKKDYANCIPYSQAVTHPSTNGTRRSLTSGSWRDRVRSTWYGRWQVYCQINGSLFKDTNLFVIHANRATIMP